MLAKGDLLQFGAQFAAEFSEGFGDGSSWAGEVAGERGGAVRGLDGVEEIEARELPAGGGVVGEVFGGEGTLDYFEDAAFGGAGRRGRR